MLKKGCVAGAASCLALFGVYVAVLKGLGLPLPLALGLGVFGSLGFLMLGSQLWAVAFGDPDRKALERARHGLPMADGRREAVWGPVLPLGAPLAAPFSGRPCVAYEYEVKDRSGNDEAGSALTGFALCPSVVRSDRGDVRLLAFSLLDEFPWTVATHEPGAAERARAFVASTRFEPMGLAQIGSMLSSLSDAMTDDDGSVRKDWSRQGPGPIELEGQALRERAVRAGETVTAIGTWSVARGALVASHQGKQAPVRLLPGGGEAMVLEARKRPWGLLLFALVWSGFAHLFIWLAVNNLPR